MPLARAQRIARHPFARLSHLYHLVCVDGPLRAAWRQAAWPRRAEARLHQFAQMSDHDRPGRVAVNQHQDQRAGFAVARLSSQRSGQWGIGVLTGADWKQPSQTVIGRGLRDQHRRCVLGG